MNHSEARLLIGAEPHSVPAELADHLKNCPECAQFQREMLSLEERIGCALRDGPIGGLGAAPVASVTPIANARGAAQRKLANVWSGWALAASVAVVSVLVIWALHPTNTLAHDVVTHVEGEAYSWHGTEPAPPRLVSQILANAGVALDMGSDKVTYAQSCLFRGHTVPHLVVRTARGPVTVLILRNEKVKDRMRFHEDGMTGVITPAPHGSIAVLAQGDADVDAAAQQIQKSVRWLDPR
jgi:hypothetical protein